MITPKVEIVWGDVILRVCSDGDDTENASTCASPSYSYCSLGYHSDDTDDEKDSLATTRKKLRLTLKRIDEAKKKDAKNPK